MQQQDRLEAIVALCEATAWAADTTEVYQRIVSVAGVFFECDGASLHLLDFDGKNLTRRATYGDLPHDTAWGDSYSVSIGRSKCLLENGKPIVMRDYENPDPRDVIPSNAIDFGYKSAISIPLSTPQGVLGMLTFTYKRPLPWSDDDMPFLVDVGRVLGVTLQRVTASKKDLELEILRERKRLSVEIHDNLSQMVSSLAMRADTALMCYEEGNHDAVKAELEKLGAVSRDITKVLREEMLVLRMSPDQEQSLPGMLRGQAELFERQWGIRTDFEVLCGEDIRASGHAALQLTRILSESLSNVLRHARADSVKITLSSSGAHVEMTVEDDGRGFDPASVPQERLGLRIMQERASSARGALRIESGSRGTKVIANLHRG